MIKHEVMNRDKGRCTFVHPNGKRCREGRYLEFHHLRPVSQGGEHTAENLILLCSAHHKHWHLRMAARRSVHQQKTVQQRLELGG